LPEASDPDGWITVLRNVNPMLTTDDRAIGQLSHQGVWMRGDGKHHALDVQDIPHGSHGFSHRAFQVGHRRQEQIPEIMIS
jgi:hypothetical protein